MRERLIDLLKGAEAKVTEMNSTPLALEEWLGIYADYLLENGVIVPPVWIGDTVYFFDDEGCLEDSGAIYEVSFNSEFLAFDMSELGKTVFHTEEEAEQALKGGAENAKVY